MFDKLKALFSRVFHRRRAELPQIELSLFLEPSLFKIDIDEFLKNNPIKIDIEFSSLIAPYNIERLSPSSQQISEEIQESFMLQKFKQRTLEMEEASRKSIREMCPIQPLDLSAMHSEVDSQFRAILEKSYRPDPVEKIFPRNTPLWDFFRNMPNNRPFRFQEFREMAREAEREAMERERARTDPTQFGSFSQENILDEIQVLCNAKKFRLARIRVKKDLERYLKEEASLCELIPYTIWNKRWQIKTSEEDDSKIAIQTPTGTSAFVDIPKDLKKILKKHPLARHAKRLGAGKCLILQLFSDLYTYVPPDRYDSTPRTLSPDIRSNAIISLTP